MIDLPTLKVIHDGYMRILFILLCLLAPTWVLGQETAKTGPDSGKNLNQSVSSAQQQKPRWEIGLAGGYYSSYDYPASKDPNRRVVGLPFFVFRTPLVRVGDGGIRAVAIENPKIKLDISAGGSLNASSAGNQVREGMPNLDYLFEVGPQLEVRVFDHTVSTGGRIQARFTSELRAVAVTDFTYLKAQGVVADIGAGLNYRNFRNTGVDLYSSISVVFASEKLQDYFYEVKPEFSTDSRPVFDAKGGYLQSRMFVGVGYRVHKNLRIFVGGFHGFFDGARNQGSPLFETTGQSGFAAGFAWVIKKSKATVDVIDLGSDS